MAKILFLAHRPPFPPNKGEKIRAFHILQHLVQRHQVWLGAPADDRADLEHAEAAREICEEVCFPYLGQVRRSLNMMTALLSGAPLSVSRFDHPHLQAWVDDVMARIQPDLVYVYSSAMARYVQDRMAPNCRMIIDFVDADAEKWRAYAQSEPFPHRLIYALEFQRLTRFERHALEKTSAAIVISETEKALLEGFHAHWADRFLVTPNGVDTTFFQRSDAPSDPGVIVFCGTMDYLPNIDGAMWFADEILPLVRKACPHAVFRIVGAKPAAQIRALAERAGVEVTGSVPDVRPYLAGASVVVAPLRIARGIQNKVLEGMAAGRPMVATPQALDGIDARVGDEVLTGEDAQGLADAVVSVLTGAAPTDLGARGRDYVLTHHQWRDHLAGLDAMVEALAAS